MLTELRDGTEVQIRPIRPEDRDALAAGFERLSPESRYRRFFAPVRHLSTRDLRYLTEVDHHDHEALVVIDPASGDLVGVARFVRTEDGDTAEPAMVVADDWQGRGVAGRLLAALVDRAREEGVRTFVASVLASNRGAMHVLERIGATRYRHLGREVELTIALPADPWEQVELPVRRRAPLAEALRAAAAGTFAPTQTLWDLAVLRRPDPPEKTQNVVVIGTDGSEDAAVAVRQGAEIARLLGAEVDLVAAYRPLLDDRDEMDALLHDTAAALAPLGLAAVDRHLRRGDPAEAIVDVAVLRAARLIAVGSRGRGGGRWQLGSVSDKIALHAPCAVLIAR